MNRAKDRLRDMLDSGEMMRPDQDEFMEILIDEIGKEKAIPPEQ